MIGPTTPFLWSVPQPWSRRVHLRPFLRLVFAFRISILLSTSVLRYGVRRPVLVPRPLPALAPQPAAELPPAVAPLPDAVPPLPATTLLRTFLTTAAATRGAADSFPTLLSTPVRAPTPLFSNVP